MIPKEILKRVKQIEISTSRLVMDVFAGQYHSIFKGQGIEFDEVREYQVGDDVRSIDWNVTARMGKPFIKKYVEERELTLMIMVDISPSGRFASIHALKSQLAAEISSLLALSAIRNNDKVGLILFTDRVEKFIPPRKGLKHVLRIIREVLYFENKGKGTDIISAIDYLNHVTNRRSIVFLISDFLDPAIQSVEQIQNSIFKRTLSVANRRHDLTVITLNDPKEINLPDCGIVSLEDAESKEEICLDTSNKALRQKYNENNQNRLKQRERLFRSTGIEHIDLSTGEPYVESLVKFFKKRKK